jgi:hypothetical protein
MENQASRYEVNRSVRTVLARHDVDLSRLDYSYIGGTVYLYGDLLKSTEGEFTPATIEVLAREVTGLPHVRDLQCDLNNWTILTSSGSWQVTKRKKPSAGYGASLGGAGSTDSTVVIEKPEPLSKVVEEITKQEAGKKNPEKKL